MKFKLITDLPTIMASEDSWNRVAGDKAMLRWEWMAMWLKHFESDVSPAVICATDENDQWVGVAPFCIESSNSFSRKMRLISSGMACGDYLGLIATEGNHGKFAEGVADFIVDNMGTGKPLGNIDLLELEGIAADDQQSTYFCELLSALGFSVSQVDLEACWVVELPTEFEELKSSFSKSMRRKVKSAVKAINAENCEITYANKENFDVIWEAFVDLHQRRRHTLGQPGCFADENFSRFLKEVAQRKIAIDRAAMVLINLDGQPLASMLLFEEDDSVLMYQSGLDPSRSKLNPGYQMIACAIIHAIDKSKKSFDFLRGDEPYKARWKSERRQLKKVRLVPSNLTARLKDGTWRIGKSIKDCVMQFRQPTEN